MSLRAAFAVCLAFFTLSAIWGASISHLPDAAQIRLTLFGVGLGVWVALAYLPRQAIITLLLTAPLFALFFVLSADWSVRLGKLPVFDPLLRVMLAIQPPLPPFPYNTNTAGGILAMCVPLLLGLALEERQGTGLRRMLFGAAGVTGLGLLLSLSRGAWAATALVAMLGGIGWLIDYRRRSRRNPTPARRSLSALWLVAIVLAPSMVYLLSRWIPFEPVFAFFSANRGSFAETLQLVRDTWLTGIGFDGFPLAFSTYTLLLHVPFITHAHSLFLDIALYHGALGLLSFVGMSVVALLMGGLSVRRSPLLYAGVASLAVVLFHGMVDDPFHGDRDFLPLLFVPFGVIFGQYVSETGRRPVRPATWRPALALGAAFTALGATLLVPTPPIAAFHASFGALRQTQIELSVYADGGNTRWGIPDAVRLAQRDRLVEAIAHYREALRIDPANETANRRLGQIELTLAQYDAARTYLTRAYQADPLARNTRLLLGEAMAIGGDESRAAELWRAVVRRDEALGIREAWHASFAGRPDITDRIRAARAVADRQVVSPSGIQP
jgi:O-Antigen ligase